MVQYSTDSKPLAPSPLPSLQPSSDLLIISIIDSVQSLHWSATGIGPYLLLFHLLIVVDFISSQHILILDVVVHVLLATWVIEDFENLRAPEGKHFVLLGHALLVLAQELLGLDLGLVARSPEESALPRLRRGRRIGHRGSDFALRRGRGGSTRR